MRSIYRLIFWFEVLSHYMLNFNVTVKKMSLNLQPAKDQKQHEISSLVDCPLNCPLYFKRL